MTNLGVKLLLENGQYLAALTKAQSETAKTTARIEKSFKSVGSNIGSKLSGAFGAVAAAVAAVAGSVYFMSKETQEAQANQAKLEAVIKSTGGAAGVTADQANDLAQSLSKITSIDDDLIVGAEAVLLRFRNMSGDVFPQATQAALDLSVATGKDLNQAALMVGKAIQDPVKGMTALNKIGVTLTATQEQQIKNFKAMGDSAGASQVIFDALGKSFGGSAAAQAKTFGGALNVIKNTAGDIAKTVGNNLTPGLSVLASTMARSSDKGGVLARTFDWIGDRANKFLVALAYIGEILDQKFGSESDEKVNEYTKLSQRNLEYAKEQSRLAKKAAAEGRAAEAQMHKDLFSDAIKSGNEYNKKAQDILDGRIERLRLLDEALKSVKKTEKETYNPNNQNINNGETEEEKLEKIKQRVQSLVQTTMSGVGTMVQGIGSLFDTLAQNQLQALEHAKKDMDMYIGYAEQQALAAAGVQEKTRAQSAQKEVADLQRQISKTTSLTKKKALQQELVEAKKERKKYEIQEEYEKKRQLLDAYFDLVRSQLQRKQFERNKQYQISMVWINTAAAITAAWLAAWSMGFPPLALAMGAVSTALLLANAGIQTAQISMQKAPAYEQGSWYVPQTGPAIVHQGEFIANKPLADDIRAAILGQQQQKPQVVFNGPVFDKVGVAKVLKDVYGFTGMKTAHSGVY